MSLRERADEIAVESKRDRSKIGALIVEYPDDADDIRDLLLGEPRLRHSVVVQTLGDAYELDIPIQCADVAYWRRVNR